MFEVTVAARFEAAHRLVGDFGPATRTHGHTYRLQVTIRGEALAPNGTLLDVGELRQAVDALAGSLHYTASMRPPGCRT
jgi:6-pyruvoyltetrahydropterin/6-carboxytetrahydropterin synthase